MGSLRSSRSARRHTLAAACATFLLAGAMMLQADDHPASSTAPVAADETSTPELPVIPGKTDKRDGKSHDEYKSKSEHYDEMAVLDRLLAMPSDQLARVRHAVEQIEAMDPEEREALRDRLNAFRKISPEDRQKMREKWRNMTSEERHEHVKKMRERRWDDVFKPDNNGEGQEEECEEPKETPEQ